MHNDADVPARPYERIPLAEAILGDLAKLRQRGMDIARAKSDQACRDARESKDSAARSETPKGGDPAEAFNRVSRHVRFTAALELMIADYLEALRAGDPGVEFWPRGSRQKTSRSSDTHNPEAEPGPDRMDRRDQLHGSVLDLANPMALEPLERERLYDNLHERMYESERYDALLDLPVDQAVAAICKDLGVIPQYDRWEGLDWPPWRQGKPSPEPEREPGPEPAPWRARDWPPRDELAPAGVPPDTPPYGDTG